MNWGFHPEARAEYREAISFYEARRIGLGAEFTREVEAALCSLLNNPQRYGFLEPDVRRCSTKKFPYKILYTVEKDFVLIIAVAHGSRAPGYWHERNNR